MSSVDEDQELWVLLIRARDAISRVRQKELDSYGIFARQSAALYFIGLLGEKATPTKISRDLFRARSSVSELLVRMENDGLLRKEKDSATKKQLKIVLTEKGREAYHNASKRESIKEIMSVLSEQERKQLQSCLHKLWSKALEKLGKESLYFPDKYQ